MNFLRECSVEIQAAVGAWETRPGASLETIRQVEGELGVKLPADLAELYQFSNGASGTLGRSFLQIEPVEGIADRTDDYDFAETAPDYVLFGTNGGAEGFAIDRRSGVIVVLPLHAPQPDDIVVQGSFRAFLERVAADTQFGDGD